MKKELLGLVLLCLTPIHGSAKIIKNAWTGLASYYGKQHEGKRMANGHPYRKNLLTAAHRFLPFGSKVRVFNLSNGKFVDVVISDRGPFIDNRVIDLSEAAAKKIDMINAGITRITLVLLDEKKS